MQDRIPLYPGRVTLTPVSGQANTYDMVRADQPTQEGTPLNKANLLTDATAAQYGLEGSAVPDEVLNRLSAGILAKVDEKFTKHICTNADRAIGSTVKLNVGRELCEFIVIHQGKPSSAYDDSCNGTWVMMKDCYSDMTWHSTAVNDYASSDIHTYLNSDFLNLLDASAQSQIKQVKIPYRSDGNSAVVSGENGLSAKVFLLSYREGAGTTTYDEIGAPVEYFAGLNSDDAAPIRVSYLHNTNTADSWYTRSPLNGTTNVVELFSATGARRALAPTTSCGIRPVMILPSDGEFIYYTDTDGNVYDAGDIKVQLTDVLGASILGSQIVGGIKMEMGSYTGTGVYGDGNQNSLTFTGKPVLVIIGGDSRAMITATAMPSALRFASSGDDYYGGINVTWTGNGLSWREPNSALNQMNTSGATYKYMAITQ